MAQQFITRLGPHGRLTLPAEFLPWKPGTRLYWTCRLHPSSGGKAVFASPHPLGCLNQGRYYTSRVKALGCYSHTREHKHHLGFHQYKRDIKNRYRGAMMNAKKKRIPDTATVVNSVPTYQSRQTLAIRHLLSRRKV